MSRKIAPEKAKLSACYTVDETAQLLGVGRNLAYEAIVRGRSHRSSSVRASSCQSSSSIVC
jgi:hypothetical protein